VRKVSPEFREKFGEIEEEIALGPETNVPDLPPYSLDVQPWNSAPTPGCRTGTTGDAKPRAFARERSSANLGRRLLCPRGKEMLLLDFFSHVERVREFCNTHAIAYREAAPRCLVVPYLSTEQLANCSRARSGNVRHARRACRAERRPCARK